MTVKQLIVALLEMPLSREVYVAGTVNPTSDLDEAFAADIVGIRNQHDDRFVRIDVGEVAC